MEKYICHGCIGDILVKQRIKKEGSLQKCSYCNKRIKSIDFSKLAEWVDPVYRENYKPGEEYPVISESSDHVEYRTNGEFPEDIISEMLDVPTEIASDLVEGLSASEYHDIKDGEEALYDATSTYEETPVSSYQHSSLWEEFCHKVKHESRFYNTNASSILDHLFTGLDSFEHYGSQSPIRRIDPASSDTFIFRARKTKDDSDIIKMKMEAYKEIGPPPKSKSVAGRMNPQGISVFYGSMDSETCVCEIRLPVGGKAVMAKFKVIKPLTVLDLTVLKNIYANLSMFDPEFELKVSRLRFLREFEEKIREPIVPSDTALDYIPTQALAEYLANYYEPKIDAIIYSSAQVTGEGKRNIVILPHAASVRWPTEEKEKDQRSVQRIFPDEDSYLIIDSESDDDIFHDDYPSNHLSIEEDYNINTHPALEIDDKSITVVEAISIRYEMKISDVSYFRSKPGDKILTV